MHWLNGVLGAATVLVTAKVPLVVLLEQTIRAHLYHFVQLRCRNSLMRHQFVSRYLPGQLSGGPVSATLKQQDPPWHPWVVPRTDACLAV